MVYRKNLSTLKSQRGGGGTFGKEEDPVQTPPTSDILREDANTDKTNMSMKLDEAIPSPPENFEEIADRPVSETPSLPYQTPPGLEESKVEEKDVLSEESKVEEEEVLPDVSTWEKYEIFLKKANKEEKKKLIDTLETFSTYQFFYINQIFGDEYIRKFIDNLTLPNYGASNKKLMFLLDRHDTMGDHHLLKDKITGKRICSVNGSRTDKDEAEAPLFQNEDHNINDTLCQSYSLLEKFGGLSDKYKPFKWKQRKDTDYDGEQRWLPDRSKKEKNKAATKHQEVQKEIIKFYRDILQTIKQDKTILKNFKNLLQKRKQGIRPGEKNRDQKWQHKDIETGAKIAKPFSKQTADQIIKEIEITVNDWDKYGYIYFIGDPHFDLTGVRTQKDSETSTDDNNSTGGGRVRKTRKKSDKKSDKKSRKRTSKKD